MLEANSKSAGKIAQQQGTRQQTARAQQKQSKQAPALRYVCANMMIRVQAMCFTSVIDAMLA